MLLSQAVSFALCFTNKTKPRCFQPMKDREWDKNSYFLFSETSFLVFGTGTAFAARFPALLVRSALFLHFVRLHGLLDGIVAFDFAVSAHGVGGGGYVGFEVWVWS